jgi:putative ABC transport system ATP-binding protein
VALESLYREPEARQDEVDWPALEFNDVFKIYRSGPAQTVALRGLDLELAKGDLVAVLGPSGCGKSTLLSLAAGLDQPSAGEVRAFGAPLGAMDEPGLARHRARRVAIIFQGGNLLSALNARENVATAVRLAGLQRASERALDALGAVGLASRAEHRVSELSGGEQQRVAIAAALARDAPLVLADEPTGELDSESESRVVDLLAELPHRIGSTVLIVTHSERVAAAAGRVIGMRDGRELG